MSGIMENSPSTLPRASSVGLSDIFLFDQANGDGTYTTRGVPLAVLGPALAGAIVVSAAGVGPTPSAGYLSNEQTISTATTFAAGVNILSVGPITIPDNVPVILPNSSNWKVL